MRKILVCTAIVLLLTGPPIPRSKADSSLEALKTMIGRRDSILVTDPDGRVLISKNENRPLIPASTLKLFTALVALHTLGPEYRFETEFYCDDDDNLTIKGYGDPGLVSEVLPQIAHNLALKLVRVNNIILDASHFAQPLEIPGISSSSEPYDAPNGALCVNFNTVFFKKVDGVYLSAEPQTPLLPMVLERITSSGLNEGRIVLSHNENEITLYSGYLFDYFLRQVGIEVTGKIAIGTVRPDRDHLIYRHRSPKTLSDTIAGLLTYSNNYTTNQILIAAGVRRYGPPGTLEKGVQAARDYARKILKIDDIHISEGSGISRNNRITARDMQKVLDAFAPYHTLMRSEGRQFYKTGTLHGISTRAGYIESPGGGLNRFVVLVNSPGRSAEKVTRRLIRGIEQGY
jgi:D-alanyl-D-alanine carboxypeptidase/D-alanyl-D-alanine-endopeptidase (penicillin-binding protein 4)